MPGGSSDHASPPTPEAHNSPAVLGRLPWASSSCRNRPGPGSTAAATAAARASAASCPSDGTDTAVGPPIDGTPPPCRRSSFVSSNARRNSSSVAAHCPPDLSTEEPRKAIGRIWWGLGSKLALADGLKAASLSLPSVPTPSNRSPSAATTPGAPSCPINGGALGRGAPRPVECSTRRGPK